MMVYVTERTLTQIMVAPAPKGWECLLLDSHPFLRRLTKPSTPHRTKPCRTLPRHTNHTRPNIDIYINPPTIAHANVRE